jgi:hypothetical protein
MTAMNTTSKSTIDPAPEKPGLADRVDLAVDKAQTKLDSAIDAAQKRAHTTSDELSKQGTAGCASKAIEHAIAALDAAQSAVEHAVRKAKDALQT